jgi:dCMP deaminase
MEEIKSTTHTRISWDNYFMNIADVVKTRSLDTKTQVGAVLVSMKDNRIISTGYNSVCAGMDDSLIDWTNRDYVHQIVIHAETNAVLYAQSKFEDAILYSTLSPCKDCIKLLSATKIRKIIYKDEYRDIEYVKNLCNFFKIELIRFEN